VTNSDGEAVPWTNEEIRQVDVSADGAYDNIPLDEIEFSYDPAETGIAETSFSETTPLLSAGTSAGAVTGGTGLSNTAIAGGAIGIGTAAAGLGLAIGLSGGANIPGHHYIGPGNDEDGPEPVDKDDLIAKHHDIAYSKATSKQDVVDADTVAIDAFDQDWRENQNYHSLLGRTGLQAKKAIESVIGVQYPPDLPSSISGELWVKTENLDLVGLLME
jgi:hypothetical protein